MSQLPTRPQLADASVRIGLEFAASGAIRETAGSNRSPVLDKYEAVFDLCGASYCEIGHHIPRLKALCYAVFPGQPIDAALLRRARVLHEQRYGPCLTGCTDTIAAYTRRKRWRPYAGACKKDQDEKGQDEAAAQANRAAWIAQIRAGDGVIYDFSTPGNFDRHFETFVGMERDPTGQQVKNEDGLPVLVCIGWNTVPDAGSSDGAAQGCYVRHRPLNHAVLGSLDENSL